MISVVKAVGATVANGALQLVYQDTQGILRDVFAASYQIWTSDFVTQKFPVSGRQALDVVVPSGVNRAGVGRYNATWTSSAETGARYAVRWFLTPKTGDAEITFDQEFELVPNAYRGPHNCGLQDLRDEGLPTTVTDAQAQLKIVAASRYGEIFTGRRFGAFYQTIELDGTGARTLLLSEPIVAIEKAVITFDSIFNSTSQESDPSSFKVYNRYLKGLIQPDDRDSPKIEFIHGDEVWGRERVNSIFQDRVIWPKGVRNIQLTGLFGYTEGDDSFTGHVPDLVREVTKMIVFENLNPLSAGGAQTRGPITKERTRDQEVDYAALRQTGMTGNRSIDVLLAGLRRPPNFGSA